MRQKSNNVLFVDRDGVINVRNSNGYITNLKEFVFIDGVIEAFSILKKHFSYIFVVTNQQGIGKKLMTEEDLNLIHKYMLKNIHVHFDIINKIYYCPHTVESDCYCRKPAIGMYEQAIADYPSIANLPKIMIGDTLSDMKFGRNCGMTNVLVTKQHNFEKNDLHHIDIIVQSLHTFAKQFI